MMAGDIKKELVSNNTSAYGCLTSNTSWQRNPNHFVTLLQSVSLSLLESVRVSLSSWWCSSLPSCHILVYFSLLLSFWVPKHLSFWTAVLKTLEILGLQGDPTSPSLRRSVLGVLWKDWCWSWNSNTLSTWCKELIHLKRPWCWKRLRAGGEGDDRGWDGWMASLTEWTWALVGSGS